VGAGDASSAGIMLGLVAERLRSRLGGRPIGTFLARVTRGRLDALAALVASGRLRPVIGTTVPLEGAPAALDELLDGRARGKTVVQVAAA
jgi:NADPH:quinone reductase-like Zn-dependent oxidoreductase